MAHFAKISDDNIVLQVLTLDNSVILNSSNVEEEALGQQYLETHNNWPAEKWIQTSFNTYENKHRDGGTPLRGNYAGIGYEWDSANNIFWPEKPHPSWVKNTSTAIWDPPITYPSVTNDGADPVVWKWLIDWNEAAYQSNNLKGWEGIKENVDGSTHSDTSKYDWNGTNWVAQ